MTASSTRCKSLNVLPARPQPKATESVRQSVNVIDAVLREVLAESGQPHESAPAKAIASWQNTRSKSA
jgi:hypothetical protein